MNNICYKNINTRVVFNIQRVVTNLETMCERGRGRGKDACNHALAYIQLMVRASCLAIPLMPITVDC